MKTLPREIPSKISKNFLANQVYDVLFDLIVKNELVPGFKLNVDGVSKQLGVSRSPVAAAFSALERDGFLVVMPQRGTFVRELSRDELNAIYLARSALEKVVVFFAIGKASQKKLLAFRKRFAVFHGRVAFTEADILAEFTLDLELHAFLGGFLPEIVRRNYQNICNLTRRSRLLNLEKYFKDGVNDSNVGVHIQIIDAFLEENRERGTELLEYDVTYTRNNVLRNFD